MGYLHTTHVRLALQRAGKGTARDVAFLDHDSESVGTAPRSGALSELGPELFEQRCQVDQIG